MDPSGKRPWQVGATNGPSKRRNTGTDVMEDELIADAEAADAERDMFGDEDYVRQEEEEDFELDLGEAGRNWERPPPPTLRPARDKISELQRVVKPIQSSTSGSSNAKAVQ